MAAYLPNWRKVVELSRAFEVLYDEASVQIERLRADYPEAAFMNLAHDLTPLEKYFWDLGMSMVKRICLWPNGSTGKSGRRLSRRWRRPGRERAVVR